MIRLFDTHAHLGMIERKPIHQEPSNHHFFDQFPQQVKINNDFDNIGDFQMTGILNVGISLASSVQSVNFSAQNEILYASVGIHPNCKDDLNDEAWHEITELSQHQNVTAIGETGLDRYRDATPWELQLRYFNRHLDLAKIRNLPILIHSRDCDDEMLAVLGDRAKVSSLFGVIHSFSSTPAVAEKYLDMGLYISFSGSVTYINKKFAALREAAKVVPDDRLLVETDSPFLTPHPYRGKLSDNVPMMTAYVARTLAELRGTTLENIAAVTTANAEKIFRKK